ncbi:MAG: hypothetical protein E6Q61_05820 [Nitrosomonas sp.]|nr:MAG: hypothetical protein E6Q61_05820 [Nitrosomonas sp.]
MPKVIITDSTIPIALHELDKWSGKLTWELYAERLASVLGEKRISRYTLLSYPVLADAFKQKKNLLRAAPQSSAVEVQDVTLEFAKKQIETLEAKVARLERENNLFREQFVRWQHNLYMMPHVDMEKLNAQVDKPLPALNRR